MNNLSGRLVVYLVGGAAIFVILFGFADRLPLLIRFCWLLLSRLRFCPSPAAYRSGVFPVGSHWY